MDRNRSLSRDRGSGKDLDMDMKPGYDSQRLTTQRQRQ